MGTYGSGDGTDCAGLANECGTFLKVGSKIDAIDLRQPGVIYHPWTLPSANLDLAYYDEDLKRIYAINNDTLAMVDTRNGSTTSFVLPNRTFSGSVRGRVYPDIAGNPNCVIAQTSDNKILRWNAVTGRSCKLKVSQAKIYHIKEGPDGYLDEAYLPSPDQFAFAYEKCPYGMQVVVLQGQTPQLYIPRFYGVH